MSAALLRRHPRETTLLAALLALFGVDGFYALSTFRSLAIDNLPVLLAAAGMTLVIVAGQTDISIGSQFVAGGIAAGLLAKSGLPMPLVVLPPSASAPRSARSTACSYPPPGYPPSSPPSPPWSCSATACSAPPAATGSRISPPASNGSACPRASPRLPTSPPPPRSSAYSPGLYETPPPVAPSTPPAVTTRPPAASACPPRQIVAAFAVLGVATALAALLNFTRYPTIETNAGLGFELKVIAAVVVGGASITGGRGSLFGTLLGVALLGSIGTVFTFLHVAPAWEKPSSSLSDLDFPISEHRLKSPRRRADERV